MKTNVRRTICLVVLLFGLGHTLNVSALGIAPSSTSKSTSKLKFNKMGRHLILELMDCKFPEGEIDYKIILWFAAYVSGAEILKVETHDFTPEGWTGFVLLGESHISVHTWPEFGYAAIDIFTCGEHVNMNKTFVFLLNFFQPGRLNYVLVNRGYDV